MGLTLTIRSLQPIHGIAGPQVVAATPLAPHDTAEASEIGAPHGVDTHPGRSPQSTGSSEHMVSLEHSESPQPLGPPLPMRSPRPAFAGALGLGLTPFKSACTAPQVQTLRFAASVGTTPRSTGRPALLSLSLSHNAEAPKNPAQQGPTWRVERDRKSAATNSLQAYR